MTLVNYDERADHIDTMAKQGAEIERLKAELESSRHYQTIQNEDIGKLRQLLGECREFVANRKATHERNKCYKLAEQCQYIITKIDEVLK